VQDTLPGETSRIPQVAFIAEGIIMKIGGLASDSKWV
jgi:hypothetical protein